MSKTTHHTTRVESEEESFYRPKCASKSVIISRSSGRQSLHGGLGGSMHSARLSTSLMSNPAVYSKISSSGIADFRGTREKEKREMQECNTRLASYIESMRWLEAKNKQLEAELEAYRNRKMEDWKPIKQMFQGELDQARKVIDEMSVQRGINEAKVAGLQDEIQSLRERCAMHDANAKDYLKKIDQLNGQIGEYEGELNTLRLRIGSLEDELAKLRNLYQKAKDDNARLRTDLDNETAAHIEYEVMAQSKQEQIDFLEEVLEQLKINQEPVKVKGLNLEEFFKGELRRSIQGIQEMYDDRLDSMCAEIDAKYASQVNQLRSGNVRDNLESEHAKSEIKRMRESLSDKSKALADLEAKLAAMKAERDNYFSQVSETQLELDNERQQAAKNIADLQDQIESLLQQITNLVDAKISMETEICCYKKLLEGEENRTGLRQLVQENLGVHSSGSGGASLANIIGQSSISSSMTARTTVQRTSKGPVGFQSVDAAGGHVIIENTSSGGRAKTQSLNGWRLKKVVRGKTTTEIPLDGYSLKPGASITLYAKGAKSVADNENEIICDCFSFGTGDGTYTLIDERGDDKATLKLTEV